MDKGSDEVDPLETIRLFKPDVPANPDTERDFGDCAPMMSGVPSSEAVHCAVKPVPVIVAVKVPRGSGDGVKVWITGVELSSVTMAVPVPPGPAAVTVSLPAAGMLKGAV
jgi:hypothetical protein